MTMLVVAASVAAKWFFPEEHSSESRRLLSPRRTLLAPDLIWSEFGNIAWKRVRRGEIKTDEAAQIVADLVRLPLDVVPTLGLLAPALELAIATDRTVYDCIYLAMAIDRKCRLVTADERFVNALASTPFAKHIRHVARLR
ncbi:MAG: type II toxin-antitoxin system VapC family toxin [Pirellulales bacterium]